MKKKMIGIALLCILLLSLAAGCGAAGPQSGAENMVAVDVSQGTAPAEVSGDELRVFEEPGMGLKFRWPDAWYDALFKNGCISPSGFASGIAFDYFSPKGREAAEKLYASPDLPADPDAFTAEQKELLETVQNNTIPLLAFIAEKDGERDEAARSLYSAEKVLGEKDGTVYTMLTNPDADLSALTDAEKAEYEELLAATAEFEKEMTLSGMKDLSGGGQVSFDSETLDGEKIDSSVFKDHKLTAINLWATWCGPCVKELPELQKLYEDMPEGANLLAICTDGAEEGELAKKMRDESGVKYQNIVANQEMLEGFLANVQGFPTTIFVDSEGNMVGEPLVGVPGGDVVEAYRAAIEERLALLEQ